MPKRLADELVTVDSAVTLARQGFKTVLAKRIAWAAIARTSQDTWNPQHERHSVTLRIQELAETFPAIERNDLYGDIRKVLAKLLATSFQIQKGEQWGAYNWFNSVEYHSGTGAITLTFTDTSSRLLENLKAGHFDQYLLKDAAGFTTLKSWRLFELLERWRKTGWYEITVSQLISVCEVDPNYNKDFAQFRRWFLEPAIAEINKLHPWNLNFIPIKDGRKITKIRFEFSKEKAPKARKKKEAGPLPVPASLPLPAEGPRQLTSIGEAGLADALQAAHSLRTRKEQS